MMIRRVTTGARLAIALAIGSGAILMSGVADAGKFKGKGAFATSGGTASPASRRVVRDHRGKPKLLPPGKSYPWGGPYKPPCYTPCPIIRDHRG